MAVRISVSVLITAAGLSLRFKQTSEDHVKKEFYSLQGEPILNRTVRVIIESLSNSTYALKQLIITCTPGLIRETEDILGTLNIPSHTKLMLVEGGSTRQDSVYNGLLYGFEKAVAAAPPELVLIHDASRPWVTKKLILSTLEAAHEFGGAAPVIPLIDAIKSIDNDMMINGHYDRRQFVGIQTPQTFRFSEILSAHRTAKLQGKMCHDDTEVFTDWGGKVKTVPGDPVNKKITFYSDVKSHTGTQGEPNK